MSPMIQAQGHVHMGLTYLRRVLMVMKTLLARPLLLIMYRELTRLFSGQLTKRASTFLISAKKDSGPDGLPYSVYRCAGGIGSQLLFGAYKHNVEGGGVPQLFLRFACDLRQWRSGACRRDYNTTSARLSAA